MQVGTPEAMEASRGSCCQQSGRTRSHFWAQHHEGHSEGHFRGGEGTNARLQPATEGREVKEGQDPTNPTNLSRLSSAAQPPGAFPMALFLLRPLHRSHYGCSHHVSQVLPKGRDGVFATPASPPTAGASEFLAPLSPFPMAEGKAETFPEFCSPVE